MKIFKVSLQVMMRHKAQILTYLIMFIAVFLCISVFKASQITTDYSEVKPNFTVINRDKETPLTKGLLTFLGDHGTEAVFEDDKQALQDAMFYHATEYILIIPEGFDASLSSNAPLDLETASVPGTGSSYYLDNLTNQYWNLIKTYREASPQMEDASLADAVLETLDKKAPVEIVSFSDSQPISEYYGAYNQVLCYILMVLVILCVSSVTIAFRRPDLHMRNLCAPITTGSRNFGQFLYCATVSFSIWLILNVVGLAFSSRFLIHADKRLIGLFLLNSFVFTVTSLALSMLVSYFATNVSLQNVFANFLSLGLSFLGGAFVPLELLSKNVLAVARFTPVYWYSVVVTKLYSMSVINAEALRPVWQALGIQLLFAAAILCAALALGKYKNKAENSFGATKTELDM